MKCFAFFHLGLHQTQTINFVAIVIWSTTDCVFFLLLFLFVLNSHYFRFCFSGCWFSLRSNSAVKPWKYFFISSLFLLLQSFSSFFLIYFSIALTLYLKIATPNSIESLPPPFTHNRRKINGREHNTYRKKHIHPKIVEIVFPSHLFNLFYWPVHCNFPHLFLLYFSHSTTLSLFFYCIIIILHEKIEPRLRPFYWRLQAHNC